MDRKKAKKRGNEGGKEGRNEKGREGRKQCLRGESCVQINIHNFREFTSSIYFPPTKLYMNVKRN